MTMPNKKANQNDRISDLPSNVIDAILGNLKIRDQVRTSILSKKWRYIWTSAPHLCFDDDLFVRSRENFDSHVISKIITDVLMLHNGPIHKFSIYIFLSFKLEINAKKLNMWIPFMSKDIKHLELVFRCTDKDQMPDILFSCKELTYLNFSSFKILSIPPNFCGFKKLLELHLFCVEFESTALESFMSGCPFLEKLSIESCTGCDYLVISSPSLKVLVLRWIDTKSICLKKAKIKRFSLSGLKKYEDIIPPMLRTSSFSSLEYLKLYHLNLKERGQLLNIVSILKSAPKLIELDIEIYDDVNTTQMTDHSKELECCSSCPKLQTVNIYVGACSQHLTLSLIQFILANSPSLKTLTFDYCYEKLDALMLDILLSCKKLTYFKFGSFNLSIPPNFCGFKKLLELHLVMVTLESGALESLMAGCPFLEKLSIENCTGCDYLVISSPSLKVLVLRWIGTKSICLKKANNLIDFTLTTYEGRGFIKSLPKIKRFSLTNWGKYEDIIPPMLRTSSFSSLEYLKLDRLNLKERGQLLHIVSILKSAPKLIELDIEIYDDVNTTQMTDDSKELECCSSCPKLQTVKIYGGCSQHATSLIKFILANSPSLKTLTVDCIFIKSDAPMLLKISQDLLRMERASPRAHVSFGR